MTDLDRLQRAVEEFGRDASLAAGTMLRVTIEDDSAEGARGFDRIFDAFDELMGEIPDVLEDALPAIRKGFADNFDTEGASGRGAWAALAPRTLRERLKLGYGPGPILTRSGALREHVLGTPAVVTGGAGGWTLTIRPTKEVDGVPKYDALAKGYEPNNLPGRPMVALGPASSNRVASAISRSLRARARLHGL